MSEKIHVGVMMENLDGSVYLGEMITELASEDAVELHLLSTEKRKVSFRAKVLEDANIKVARCGAAALWC